MELTGYRGALAQCDFHSYDRGWLVPKWKGSKRKEGKPKEWKV
jgi:hypothetical protein